MRPLLAGLFALIILLSSSSIALNQVDNTLRIVGSINSLNPFSLRNFTHWREIVINAIWEPLYTYSPDHKEIIPWIADGDPIINEQESSITVNIKKGIPWATNSVFADEHELTASDVVFTINLQLEFDIPLFIGAGGILGECYLTLKRQMVDVVAEDSHTVKFLFNQLTPALKWCALVSPILPEHQWERIIGEARENEEGSNFITSFRFNPENAQPLSKSVGQPIGTGPYTVSSWTDSVVTLIKRDGYSSPVSEIEIDGEVVELGPYVDQIEIPTRPSPIVIDDASDYLSLLVGGDGPNNPYKVPQLASSSNVTLRYSPINAVDLLAYNFRRAPFNDLAFRAATAYLTDRGAIIQRAFNGLAIETYSMIPPDNEIWHNPNVTSLGKGLSKAERIQKAVEVLEEAGYTWEVKPQMSDNALIQAGRGLTLPSGQRLDLIEITVNEENLQRIITADLIRERWEEIGILVQVIPKSFSSIVNSIFANEISFDALILGIVGKAYPGPTLYHHFHTRTSSPSSISFTGYSNPTFDQLIEEMLLTTELQTQREIAFELQQILSEDLPWLSLYARMVAEFTSNRFDGWVERFNGIANRWSLFLLKPSL